MTELMRNDLDSHDWAARAAEALEQAKKLPPGLQRFEAIRKAAHLRIAADMKNWLTAKWASGVMQQGAALVTDDASPSPLKDGELHEQLSTWSSRLHRMRFTNEPREHRARRNGLWRSDVWMSEVQKIPAVRHRKQRDRDMVSVPGELNLAKTRIETRLNANLTETAAQRGGK
jgi:hypothetical protein